MTRKEFKEHDWKIGEAIYAVRDNTYMSISIPHKVERISVKSIEGDTVFVNSKTYPYSYSAHRRFLGLSDLFFTRKDAIEALAKRQQEFIEKHRIRITNDLISRRSEVMREAWKEWSKINGMLRMNVMNK